MNQILQADIFSGLPPFQSIVYCGPVTAKLLRFEVSDGTSEKQLYLASIVPPTEKPAWCSFQDLLAHSVMLARSGLQGIFGLDLLTADIHQGVRHFNPKEYAGLLINHSKELGPGVRRMVRYGQLFALLQKRAPADWGKIDVMTHVEIIYPEKTRRKNYLRKLVRETGGAPDSIYLIHQLGARPVWGPGEAADDPPGEIYFHSAAAT
ncbi:MAG: hypothetical protein BWY42_00444 [Candidatus Omnitrophica bacterium ADurb.Bin277]|nr:MAG: hypothetical protein BWY42_00444 [Candidatus Omnitrophica bacterium ADurb.Bin277]